MPHRTWRSFIEDDHAEQHLALFYRNDDFVHRCVATWAATSLTQGGGALLVGTPPKCVGIRAELRRLGVDVDTHEASGRLLFVDAESLMTQFVGPTVLQRDVFLEIAAALISRVRAACRSPDARIRGWGEMVDLLCSRALPGQADELESLWDTALETSDIQLLCSYRLGSPHGTIEGRARSHSQALVEATTGDLAIEVASALRSTFGERVPRDPHLLLATRHGVEVDDEQGMLIAIGPRG